jgi:hypothetical protein
LARTAVLLVVLAVALAGALAAVLAAALAGDFTAALATLAVAALGLVFDFVTKYYSLMTDLQLNSAFTLHFSLWNFAQAVSFTWHLLSMILTFAAERPHGRMR